MDRSDQFQDEALEPHTERTAKTVRPAGSAAPVQGTPGQPLLSDITARAPLELSAPQSDAMFQASPIELGMAPPNSFIPETRLVYPSLPGPAFDALAKSAAAPVALAAAAPSLAAPAPAVSPSQPSPHRFDRARSAPRPNGTFASYAVTAAKYAALAVAGWMVAVVVAIGAYRFLDPPMSSLMLQRRLTGETYAHNWVPLAAISPSLVKAVLVSEDGRFCQHNGIDLEAMQVAIERAGNGTPRGASTISMQVIKNLFLWPSKSYVRKAIEVPLTVLMEFLWPKARVMEVYLNIAEWGPGVFGVEAAARHHFGKSAYRLTEREAAQLAVALPNPIRRDAGDPGPGTRRLASLIQARARMASAAQTGCVRVRK